MHRPSFVFAATRICVALAVVSAAVPSLAAGKDCEQLRSEVMRRYEAGGIAAPQLQLLPSSAVTRGKVVGSCELGSRKLVYLGGKGASAPAPGASTTNARPPAAAAPVLTECKDGTVSMGGSCKTR